MSCWANPCMRLDPFHLCGLDKATAQENNKLFQGLYSFQVNVSVLWHLLELLQIAWMCPVNIRSFAGHPWNFLTKAILHWYLASRINGKVKKKKKVVKKSLFWLFLQVYILISTPIPPYLSNTYHYENVCCKMSDGEASSSTLHTVNPAALLCSTCSWLWHALTVLHLKSGRIEAADCRVQVVVAFSFCLNWWLLMAGIVWRPAGAMGRLAAFKAFLFVGSAAHRGFDVFMM